MEFKSDADEQIQKLNQRIEETSMIKQVFDSRTRLLEGSLQKRIDLCFE